MAQSGTTVTSVNPTPPTNFSAVGATPPNVPNYTKLTYADAKNWGTGTPTSPPPYFDDGITASAPDNMMRINENIPPSGVSASPQAFAANTAALASGTGATSGGTENTYPGTDTAPFDTPNCVGAVPASSSAAHEEVGNVTTVTATVPNPSPAGQLKTVSTGPALTAGTLPNPNALHASTLSPSGIATLASIGTNNTASGGGTVSQTVTGTNFTRQSVIYVNGVAQATTFNSATSLTAPTVTKKATAGTWPVVVITAGTMTTAAVTWTFT